MSMAADTPIGTKILSVFSMMSFVLCLEWACVDDPVCESFFIVAWYLLLQPTYVTMGLNTRLLKDKCRLKIESAHAIQILYIIETVH